jgi:hypothetical protein
VKRPPPATAGSEVGIPLEAREFATGTDVKRPPPATAGSEVGIPLEAREFATGTDVECAGGDVDGGRITTSRERMVNPFLLG